MVELEIRDAEHSLRRLAAMYDSAILYSLYDKRNGGQNHNVTTVIVRANADQVSTVLPIPDIRDAVGADGKRQYGLYRALISPAEADELLADSAAGGARLPHTDITVRFSPGDEIVGFQPAQINRDALASSPLRRSLYARRRWAKRKGIGKVSLAEDSLPMLERMLPDISDIRFALLDVRNRIDVIGDVQDLYAIGLSLRAHLEEDGFHLIADGGRKWREAFPDLDVHGTVTRRFVPFADIVARLAPADSEFVLKGAQVDACDIALSSGGVPLDRLAGTLTRVTAVVANIVANRLEVEVDDRKTLVEVDVSRDNEALRVIVGSPDEVVSRIAPAFFLGKRLERDQADPLGETLLDPTDGVTAIELYQRLVEMLRASAGSPHVRVVDRFAINPDALGRMALVAAASRTEKLQILTTSRMPLGGPRFNFDREIFRISKATKVDIEIYTPTIDIHDRFLWVGNRIWHFGHSFNQYGGRGVSVVAEVRSVLARARLSEILGSQLRKPRLLKP